MEEWAQAALDAAGEEDLAADGDGVYLGEKADSGGAFAGEGLEEGAEHVFAGGGEGEAGEGGGALLERGARAGEIVFELDG